MTAPQGQGVRVNDEIDYQIQANDVKGLEGLRLLIHMLCT